MKKSNLNGWLGLVVSPLLVTYWGVRSLDRWLIEVGKASEEVFRGDRLPILQVSDTISEDSNQETNR
jgi:hypothetical protein